MIEIDFPAETFGAMVLCPKCGGSNLHQRSIEVFERPEDDRVALKVVVSNLKAVIEIDNTRDNPSPRRDGLRIRFDCETCDDAMTPDKSLAIIQHKGSTYIWWEGCK